MKKEIHIGQSKVLLEQGEFADDIAVVFLPGISGGALGARFDGIAEMVCDLGHTSARVHSWDGETDVLPKTLRHFYTEIEGVVSHLIHEGFEEIMMIGKSFGGGLVLAYEHPHVTKKVMWAPAIGVAEEETISSVINTPLGEIKNLLDVCIATEEVREDDAALCIVHGTQDTVIPLSNSEKIIKASSKGVLKLVEGADHSFKDNDHEAALLLLTKNFLGEVA